MSGDPEIYELAKQLAVLEERMETMSERYDKGWALLREDIAKRDAEAAKRDVEAAKRETRLILAMAGMIAAGVALLLAVFEFGIPG